jgi:3D (Asp-Asp-Asp) domain-containing protein
MRDRIIIILLVLIVGWYLGYQHHQSVSMKDVERLETQVASLERTAEDLRETAMKMKKVSVLTTAYSNDEYSIDIPEYFDGKTATGLMVRRGHVASDWGVFPPGTRLYVPGYGEAVVQDRGGKIRGYHLDLFMDSRDEALRWGARRMDIYVIEMGEAREVDLDTQQASIKEIS